MHTFWEAANFSALIFSLGVKGGDRNFTSGGDSRYSAGIKTRIHTIKSRVLYCSTREQLRWGTDI